MVVSSRDCGKKLCERQDEKHKDNNILYSMLKLIIDIDVNFFVSHIKLSKYYDIEARLPIWQNIHLA